MLKKTITYTDWNGNEQTEDFYFNLTNTECVELEYAAGSKTGMTESLDVLIKSKDIGSIVKIIKDIVLTAYGEKSEDGRRFVKNQNVRDGFEQCAAFDTLYMDLVTNPENAAAFLTGIMPSDVTTSLGDDPQKVLLDKMSEYKENTSPTIV